MAYCTTTDVKTFNPKRTYNTTSTPTSTQVTSCINFIYSEMNVRMSAVGITAPITTSPVTNASRFLRSINAMGAASYAEESAFQGGAKQESDHSKVLYDRYNKAMAMIEANPAIISSSASASFDSYEYSNPDEKRDDEPFERSIDKW